MSRTALLIRCTVEQALTIRLQAEKERRTVSAYVLNILTSAIEVEDALFRKLTHYALMNQVLGRKAVTDVGQRTAILVRCSCAEADQIRAAAKRRDMPINAFVLQALKRAWSVQPRPTVVPVPQNASTLHTET
jgi:uncharacterized protein (DUF1778 family)